MIDHLVVPADLALVDEDRERGDGERLAGRAGRKDRVGVDRLARAPSLRTPKPLRSTTLPSSTIATAMPGTPQAARTRSTRSREIGRRGGARAAAAANASRARGEA